MGHKRSLVHSKEDLYFILSILVSVIVYIALLFSIIGILVIVFLTLFSLILHALMLGNIRRNAIKISEEQFSEVYERVKLLCSEMLLEKIPDIYVMESGGLLNAFASRFFGKSMVVLYSDIFDLIETENEDVVHYVIAHELAHIKRRHITTQMVILPAMWVPFLGEAYSRACEYTSDRYAAYYTNSFEAAKNGLTILAIGKKLYKRVNHDAYLKQIQDESGFFIWLSEKISTHPHLPKRIQEVALFMNEEFPYYRERKRRVVLGIISLSLAFLLFGIGTYISIDKIANSSLWSDFVLGVEGSTPLMEAAYEADISRVEELLEKGEDVNAKDSDDSTALHWTVYGSGFYYEEEIETDDGASVDIASILLEAGADVNAQDVYGSTVIVSAVNYENVELVKLLLDHGADPLIQDENGMSALDYAEDYQNKDLINILKSATNK